MKTLAAIACGLFLAACEPPALEDVNVASKNLALQSVSSACGKLSEAIPAARERIASVPAADRSVTEILQLQAERNRGEQLCGPNADPINLVEIELITERVQAIDGELDQ